MRTTEAAKWSDPPRLRDLFIAVRKTLRVRVVVAVMPISLFHEADPAASQEIVVEDLQLLPLPLRMTRLVPRTLLQEEIEQTPGTPKRSNREVQ
jgi:hypothetical protein